MSPDLNPSARPGTRSYVPGAWFGIFGERAGVVLPPSEKARVAALWELLDDGAGFDETLDALIAGGLRDLPAFVLVSESGDETKVVLRGAARARFTAGGESVELEGSAATTWVERSLRGVTSATIEVDDAEAASDVDHLTVGLGLVRVARVDQPPYAAPGAGAHAAPVPAVVLEPDPEPDEEPDTESVAVPVVEPVVEPVASVPEPDEDGDEDEDDEEPESPFDAFFGGDPAEPDEPGDEPADGSSAPLAEDPPTEAWSPGVVAAPAVPVSAPSPYPATDHDGHTQAGGWDPHELAPQQPGIPGQPPAPAVTSRPVARLTFSSGETVDVDRAVLVGRAPEARRFTSTEQPRLVTVSSPNQEISSTHLEIRPGSGVDHGSAVVTDMGSTNGTVVVQPGLPPESLQPGIAVQLIPGAVIDLGDGVSIQVSNP
ncbi:MAG: FHA domain-containing protein [Nocardioides sp.]